MNFFALSLFANPMSLEASGSSFFAQIVEILFGGASDLVQQLGSLIRTVANSLIYADGIGTSGEFSTIFIIVLTLAGIAIVFGLVFGTFHFLKNALRRSGR